ncbi:hypothetical protein CRI64_19945 [Escherichia sp. E2748]|nr:hypothetical protein CRI64_19945 [Escherichia sp. E2748]
MWGKSVLEAQIYKNTSMKKDFSVTKSSRKGQFPGPINDPVNYSYVIEKFTRASAVPPLGWLFTTM